MSHPHQGAGNPVAKLDDTKVRFIRSCDWSVRALADHYQVTTQTIYLVRQNKTWRHVK